MVNFQSKEKYDVADLIKLVDVLRGEGGCPWDREQTHESLRRCMLEEAYEAVGAIDARDTDNLREELGDVMLQAIFHASLARDEGLFDLDDVADAECKKLIYRHPHVFGDTAVSGSEEVLKNWDELKKAEKSQKTLQDTLKGITPALPALWRAEKCQKKCEQAGAPVLEKEDIPSALYNSVSPALSARTAEEAEKAAGALLFNAVALCRAKGIDPEFALHRYCGELIESSRPEDESV